MGTSAGNYGRAMYSDPKYKLAMSKAQTLERVKVKKNCERCSKEFEVERTVQRAGSQRIDKKERRFCKGCSNSRTENREEINKKISEGCKGKEPWNKGRVFWSKKIVVSRYCSNCNKKINYRNQSGLCQKCLNIKRRENADKLVVYRRDCNFDFNLADYPNEFDFSLVEEHGWYKAANHGNNLSGVSRDHIVSVKYGFDNDVSSKIISHPANCRLITQRENSSKCDKSLIDIEELNIRIKEWNTKYNK